MEAKRVGEAEIGELRRMLNRGGISEKRKRKSKKGKGKGGATCSLDPVP